MLHVDTLSHRGSLAVPPADPNDGEGDGGVPRVGEPLRGEHPRLQAAEAVSARTADAEDALGLREHRADEHRRLEDDAVVGHRRRADGDGLQEVREGPALARQGDARVGHVHGAGGDREEHDHVAARGRRAAEPRHQGAPLAAADAGDGGECVVGGAGRGRAGRGGAGRGQHRPTRGWLSAAAAA